MAGGGSLIAQDFVYYLNQLIKGTISAEGVAYLLEDLSEQAKELAETAQKLRDKLESVQGAFR